MKVPKQKEFEQKYVPGMFHLDGTIGNLECGIEYLKYKKNSTLNEFEYELGLLTIGNTCHFRKAAP